jgi:hypothetical protein
MTIGAGSVWVTGRVENPNDRPIGTDSVLVRIDPATNEVSTTISLGRGSAGDVAVDESGVWVAVAGIERGQLVRVDPSSNEVAARIPIVYQAAPYQDLRDVVTVDGLVLLNQPTFENGGSAITVVDAATSQVLGTAVTHVPEDLAFSIGSLVARKGEVWADNGYQLLRIDPRTGQLLDEAVQLPKALAAGLLAADDRGLWFLGYNGRTGAGPGRCRWSIRRRARFGRSSTSLASHRTRWRLVRALSGSSITTEPSRASSSPKRARG